MANNASEVPVAYAIPVIDLEQDASVIVQQITKACQESGVFQIINHGFPENLMAEAMDVGKEFFALPAEDNEKFLDKSEAAKFEPISQKAKLYLKGDHFSNEESIYWKDSLIHGCNPIDEELLNSWPDKPTKYREVVAKYSKEVRKLTMKIMNYICEGLGLKLGYFDNELSQRHLLFYNYYPPCPDPSSTLGSGAHYDGNIITLLQQDVFGLQILNNGNWIDVEAIPTAFVVNVGLTLQVMSNDKLEGCLHRVVANSTRDRLSIANLIGPDLSCTIEIPKEVLTKDNPPHYIPYPYAKAVKLSHSDTSSYDAAVKQFRISA